MPTTTTQLETAAQITGILLERTDPALHGLELTSTPITTEFNWNTLDVELHAVAPAGSRHGNDVNLLVTIDEAGETKWFYRHSSDNPWNDMAKPHAAAALEAARAGAKADAEWIDYETDEAAGYTLDETGKALAAIITDPKLRAGLDAQTLDQARRAVGLVADDGTDAIGFDNREAAWEHNTEARNR